MRPNLHPVVLLAALALAVVASPAARAQPNPSSDDIIRGLMPQGNVSGGLTRGIRPSAPATPPAGSPPVVVGGPALRQAVPPARPGTSPSPRAPAPVQTASQGVNLSVEFRTGSADLTPQAARTLDELGRALGSSQLSAYRFRIEGHTDTVGTPDENKALSARRASAVVDYLATKFNVDRSRLEATGMGEDGLLVPTPAQTAEPRNRRVQVVNITA